MSDRNTPAIRIFTWHVHGSYLYYLTQTKSTFYLPVNRERTGVYAGKTPSFPWGDSVVEVPIERIKKLDLDLILFQSNYPSNALYLEDQYQLFSEKQLKLPKIYLEHEPPRQHPTDTEHIASGDNTLLVHVTHFNKLMWHNRVPARVIEHGVMIPRQTAYTGEIRKGLVVVNNLKKRGRRLGYDIAMEIAKIIPLDFAGAGSEEFGGVGEIPHHLLPGFMARYRFLFNPIRYSSLGLTVCEALMAGVPVFGLATTEMATVIKNGINGYTDTDPETVVLQMKLALENEAYARQLSRGAKASAWKRFAIGRFAADWEELFRQTIKKPEQESVINSDLPRPFYS